MDAYFNAFGVELKARHRFFPSEIVENFLALAGNYRRTFSWRNLDFSLSNGLSKTVFDRVVGKLEISSIRNDLEEICKRTSNCLLVRGNLDRCNEIIIGETYRMIRKLL